MTGKLREMLPLAGGEWLVSFVTRSHPVELFDKLKDKEISVEIKRYSPGRSKDANAMCWALCADIGKSLKPPLAKEDVYRMAIKAVGVYTEVVLYVWDVRTVVSRWQERGTGWFADVIDDAGTGKKRLFLYYGSSTYTVGEMRVLLDWLVDQAEQMEIPIPLSKEAEKELLERWGRR